MMGVAKVYPITKTSDVQENYSTGYVRLYRSIKNHWLWKSNRKKTKFEAWIDLILKANHSDMKEPIGHDLILLNRGQVLCSQDNLSKEWTWDRTAVRLFLDQLEADKMITLNTTNKYTIITICNYGIYNDTQPTKNQQVTSKTTTKNQQGRTFNNDNNDKEEYSTPAKPWRYSHNGFYDKQLEMNVGKTQLDKYQKLVDFLHEKDDEGDFRFENVLRIRKQISYKDYIQLKEVEKSSKRTLKEVLEGIENHNTGKKPYRNVYLTAKDWLNRDFNQEKK